MSACMESLFIPGPRVPRARSAVLSRPAGVSVSICSAAIPDERSEDASVGFDDPLRAPGSKRDRISLNERDATRASLHAKCVVVDSEKAFIGSANFTEAAQLRNIEIGLVAHRPDVAAAVERHFDGLIQYGHLSQSSLK